MKATLNAWTTLFLLAALFGLASSLFFLVRKEGRGSSNKLLGLFLLLYSLTLIESVGYWTGLQQVWPHLVNLSSAFAFLFGPVLFLYVTSVADPARVFRIRNLIHDKTDTLIHQVLSVLDINIIYLNLMSSTILDYLSVR